MEPAAAILDDKQLVRLLAHLGLPTDFPTLAPASSPPAPAGEDSQVDPVEDSHEGAAIGARPMRSTTRPRQPSAS